MIIVDANLIAYLVLKTEQTEIAEKVLAADSDWYAPVLWRSEMQNILANYIRHNLLSLSAAQMIMSKTLDMMDEREYFVSSDLVLDLASSSHCTAYDCEYVALAQQYSLKLVTFDKEIVKSFPETALFPSEFLSQRS